MSFLRKMFGGGVDTKDPRRFLVETMLAAIEADGDRLPSRSLALRGSHGLGPVALPDRPEGLADRVARDAARRAQPEPKDPVAEGSFHGAPCTEWPAIPPMRRQLVPRRHVRRPTEPTIGAV